MGKEPLSIRFHDPNDPAVTAKFLLQLFVEVNRKEAEAVINASLRGETGSSQTTEPPPFHAQSGRQTLPPACRGGMR